MDMAVEQTGWDDDADLKPMNVTEAFASGFQVQSNGNNFGLVLQKLKALADEAGNAQSLRQEAFSIVWMSPQAAKDLSYMLQDAIRAHEVEHGAIKTALSKTRMKGA